MKTIVSNGISIEFCEESLRFTVKKDKTQWGWCEDYRPCIEVNGEKVLFQDTKVITHRDWKTGYGKGIVSHFEGFEKVEGLSFETIVWVEEVTGNVYFEWVPLTEGEIVVDKVLWPGAMAFEEKKDTWYTLLNWQQGVMIPNTWEVETKKIIFEGFLGTAGAYMPWFSQVKDGEGYLAVAVTPWNAGYDIDHPAGGPYTHMSIRWEPSLGKMEYRRVMRYTFLSDCDYNDICKEYRAYVKEKGLFRSLAEKAAKNPSVNDLIGCSFVHTGIKTKVQPNSDFFDPEAPDKNDNLTPFKVRTEEMKHFHELGVEKLYLHLDGWAQPGYDNNHPDYSPACKEAGGWEDMKELADTMHECGYMFGIHDQYRDFYKSADSFDENFACRLPDGSIPEHQRWAGGPQSYLCTTQAPFYVKRNFKAIEEAGVKLDCAYLDVFTCNEGDECNNPWHRMTRRDCYDYRNACFEFLLSKNILPSSEEVNDWAIPSLVFSHYAPYDFMMAEPGKPKRGIPVPLFNLVYHDCLIEPWMMEKVSEEEDYMLYALLNGGAPYLKRDGAYPNFDGSFDDYIRFSTEEDIERCKVVAHLHEKVAKCEMVRHELVDGDPQIQRTTFSDGTQVTVNFHTLEYSII